MTGVILLVIALLLLLLLLLKISICVKYDDGIFVVLKLLFLSFTLFPKKEKIDLKEFSAKGINKKLKKDAVHIEKKKKSESKKKENKQKKKKVSDVTEAIKLISELLSRIVGRFFKYLRVKVARIRVVIATDDAAKTALQYGLAVQGVQYVVTLLENVSNFSVEKNGYISVDCDYCSEKPILDVDISFSIRAWQALALLLRAGAVFVTKSKN